MPEQSMDEIRAKRLAKLQATMTQSQPSSGTSSPLPTKDSTPVETPVAAPAPIATPTPAPKTPTTAVTKTPPLENINSWAGRELANVMGVTLDVDLADGKDVVFLEATFTEMVEDDQDPVFNSSNIDRAIIERLSEIGHDNPFKYLKDVWSKTQQSKRMVKTKDPLREQKLEILDEIDRLTSSYGLVAFQIPDMFQNGAVGLFLKDIIHNENSYSDFLIQIINRAEEEGTLIDFLNIFIPNLVSLIAKIDLNNPQYPLILNIFQLFLSEKAVAAIFTQVEGFKATRAMKPNSFEKKTILGPIFSLSPLQTSVASSYFGGSIQENNRQLNQAVETMQSEHKILLDRLFFIANKIIRASEQSRADLLEYFAIIIDKNHLRRGDHSDPAKLASDAFITNIAHVLIRLSLPFTDASLSKIDRIDINYFQNDHHLLELTDETRTNSTSAEASEYLESHKFTDRPNFISDCFYLTQAYLHYGIGGTLLTETKHKRRMKQLKNTIEQLKKVQNSTNPMMRLGALQLPRMEKMLGDLKATQTAITCVFANRDLQLEVFDFVAGSCAFLLRTIDPTHSYPRGKLNLPLIPDVIGVENVDNTEYFREMAPVPFKYFPEFTIEGVLNYTSYITKYTNNPLVGSSRLNSFVELAVTFLRCPELIGNPHLKGRIVQALVMGAHPYTDARPGYMMESFETNELVTKNLLYGLLDFYVVVEKTGSSTQFYDKFNSRYHIALILQEIWKNPMYQAQLLKLSEENEEFFIRFVARMLNDLTFLLDESLMHLAEVHKIQVELDARTKTGVESLEGTIEELESRLTGEEDQAKNNISLAKMSIKLFGLFTKEVPRAFMKPEIVGRLASMLDYNLDALVGPKCAGLKVSDPQKYDFNPKELLVSISQVFVNLSGETEFVKSVAQDSRSFKRSLFTRAEQIISRWGLETPKFISKLVKFADSAEAARLAEEEEEMEFGEIPDEYLDPLMFTLMEDPVTLPSSKVNIDRATIRAHLLSDSTDPFNRVPLKLEEVIPNDELKKEIMEFKAKSRAKGKDVEMTDA
ncbi:CYFA0S03e00298g1_1 [Cyberlindnera fabianii]|uniref:RING-type E3 ubiquitin transferase n=1 Tax=Cyberlindnera fabianii TaxID=36022 RepID=A0A061AWR8_CYBFA|nr:CYFA0S03e00298g1_1 [Cyberlindnera fabianii]